MNLWDWLGNANRSHFRCNNSVGTCSFFCRNDPDPGISPPPARTSCISKTCFLSHHLNTSIEPWSVLHDEYCLAWHWTLAFILHNHSTLEIYAFLNCNLIFGVNKHVLGLLAYSNSIWFMFELRLHGKVGRLPTGQSLQA